MLMRLILTAIINLSKKGEKDMMAMLFAERVILGKTAFKDIPKALKEKVAEVLIDSGLPELVPSNYGGSGEPEE